MSENDAKMTEDDAKMTQLDHDKISIDTLINNLKVQPSNHSNLMAADLSTYHWSAYNPNITIGGYINQASQLTNKSSYSSDHFTLDALNSYLCPAEVKLINGNKIVKHFLRERVKMITQLELKHPVFKKKFPFFEIKTRKYIRVTYKDEDTSKLVEYDIDCDIPFFMKLVNQEYNSWSKAKMKYDLKQSDN